MPPNTRRDMRETGAGGVPRAEIAGELGAGGNTVARYADMEDMSPAAPVPVPRSRPALDGHVARVDSVLEADLGAPGKQRHTAKRIYDRLVEERGHGGSYPTVRRNVAERRREHSRGGGEGYLELEWEPGTAQADFGSSGRVVAGMPTDEKLLVAALPHSDDGRCVALPSERSERACDGLRSVFEQLGRAPRTLVPGDATEAGRMRAGVAAESEPFARSGAHYRCASRHRDPYSGNEKGSVENAVGFPGRNLLVPEPEVSSLDEPDAALESGCARLSATSVDVH